MTPRTRRRGRQSAGASLVSALFLLALGTAGVGAGSGLTRDAAMIQRALVSSDTWPTAPGHVIATATRLGIPTVMVRYTAPAGVSVGWSSSGQSLPDERWVFTDGAEGRLRVHVEPSGGLAVGDRTLTAAAGRRLTATGGTLIAVGLAAWVLALVFVVVAATPSRTTCALFPYATDCRMSPRCAPEAR